MRILEKHHGNKTTYIIGKLIINGCQTFAIDKLDSICIRFYVSDLHKDSARKAYYENNKNEDWESLVTNTDWCVRRAVAEQGYGLDVLVDDEDCDVRIAARKMKPK